MNRLQTFRIPVAFLMALTLFWGCSKEIVEVHHNLIVPENQSKDYSGVSDIQVENYISKIYIDLLGVKPTPSDLQDGFTRLDDANLSEAVRVEIIREVVNRTEYNTRLFQVISGLMLNGTGEDEIEQMLLQYHAIRDLYASQGDSLLAHYMDYQIQRLENLLSAPDDFGNGTIDISEYYSRMCYNDIYDEINMGSENFVKSCFENFFKRYPTNDELKSGVEMVDGGPTTVLLKDGSSKTDFIEIVTHDEEFFEGRIQDAYNSLMLRTPNSEEQVEATKDFIENNDYKSIQISIMKTDEYAGFN